MDKEKQIRLAKQFHELHNANNILVLPNAWDVGSAVIFEKIGYKAIATTSAGVAFSLGYPDGQQIKFEDLLELEKRIINRTKVPLSIDIESGYSSNIEDVTKNVRQVIKAGAIGINFEDSKINSEVELVPVDTQCKYIQAIDELKRELEIPFFINARTDIFLFEIGKQEDRIEMVLKRSEAYIKAGADGIFVPGELSYSEIKELVNSIDAPLNIMATNSNPKINELNELKVARTSLGPRLSLVAYGVTQKLANEIFNENSIANMFDLAAPFAEINELFNY